MRGITLLLAVLSTACVGTSSAASGDASTPGMADVPAQCRDPDPLAIRSCIDDHRVFEDVRFVASPRPPGSAHWRAVQVRCAETFEAAGFEVETHRYGTGVNVVGTKQGTARPKEQVVLGAHYDHIPGCAGADDNATGVAGVLEIARTLGPVPFDRTLVVACWDEEERGLLGSRSWAKRAAGRGDDVVVYFNFDSIGFTRGEADSQQIPPGFELVFSEEVDRLHERHSTADFIAAITDGRGAAPAQVLELHAGQLDLPLSVLEIPNLLRLTPVAVDLHRSDHASFWDAGYPAIMITDTAEFRSEHYHCRREPDDISTIDWEFLGQVVRVTAAAIATTLEDGEEQI